MTRIPKFDSEIYSEETYPFTEEEYDEVMGASLDEEWQGYEDWSQQIEERAWRGAKAVDTPHGQILLKKACEHNDCPHTQCVKAQRIGGIEI